MGWLFRAMETQLGFLIICTVLGLMFVIMSDWRLTNAVFRTKLTGPIAGEKVWGIWVVLPFFLVFEFLMIWNYVESLSADSP